MLSTYSFVAASRGCVGSATCVILCDATSTVPLPVGTRLIFSSDPAALIVILPVGAMIFAVLTLPSNASPVTLAFALFKKRFAEMLPLDNILPDVVLISPTTYKPVELNVAVFALPATVISTLALLYTLILLVPFANAPTKLAAITLPLKLAVLPLNSKLTVRLLVITLPLKLAVLPLSSTLTVKLLTVTFAV